MLGAMFVIAALVAGAGPAAADGSEVIAEGNGVRITAAEYVARLKEQSPIIRARYTTLERKREFLDGLIRFKVLAAEARRRGLDRDPDVLLAVEKLMVQKLVQREFSGGGEAKPSEAALRAAYEANRAEYQRPEKVRVGLRFFAAPAKGRERERVEREASELRAKLAPAAPAEPDEAGRGDEEAEGPAEESGEDGAAAVAEMEDQGWLTREELAKRHGERVADAAFALQQDGRVSPVIGTAKGFFVVRQSGRQEALLRTFDQVRPQLEAKVSRETKTKDVEGMFSDLRKEAGVRIDDAALGRIAVE